MYLLEYYKQESQINKPWFYDKPMIHIFKISIIKTLCNFLSVIKSAM